MFKLGRCVVNARGEVTRRSVSSLVAQEMSNARSAAAGEEAAAAREAASSAATALEAEREAVQSLRADAEAADALIGELKEKQDAALEMERKSAQAERDAALALHQEKVDSAPRASWMGLVGE